MTSLLSVTKTMRGAAATTTHHSPTYHHQRRYDNNCCCWSVRSTTTAVVVAVFSLLADRSCFVALLVLASVAGFVRGDELPRFSQEPQSAVIAHHQPLTLHCRVEPPETRVRWLFNGETLDPGSHPGLERVGSDLKFARFRHGGEGEGPGNDGEYRCTATTDVGTIVSRPAVVSKPVLSPFRHSDDLVIEAYEGGYVTIPCTAPHSIPPANIQVLTPTGLLISRSQGRVDQLPSGSIVMKDLLPGDSGNYTCLAFNPVSGRNRSAPYSVRLTVIPKSQGVGGERTEIVDQSTEELKVTRGDSVLLECPVAGVGQISVEWKRAYASLPQGHTEDKFGNLRITQVELVNSGTYICETPSGQKRQVELEVQMPPAVSSEPPDGAVVAEVGGAVRLMCRGGAFPAPSVTWYHNGQKIGRANVNNAGGEEHPHRLQQVRMEDAGLYVCELSNDLGHASAVLHLVVHQPDSPDANTPADESHVDDAPGEITPADDDDDDAVESKRKFHLTVRTNNKNRNGRKKKKNGKKKKKKNRKKSRAKKEKLVPPSSPTVTRQSDQSVLVEWTVPQNDGLPIDLFRVQYKEVKPKNGPWQTMDEDIGANARQYKVKKLKPGGTYKFRIAAVYSNHDNRNSPNSRRFHLRPPLSPIPRSPDHIPKIVEAKPIIHEGNHAIGIKWHFPPKEEYTIKGFYIFYKPYDSIDDYKRKELESAVTRKFLLKDLEPDTEYQISMKSFNDAGTSEFSNTVVKRTQPREGQKPTAAPTILPPPPGTDEETDTPRPRPEPGGLDQPVILGIVLGIMLLLLVVFIAMCWWKQRQQKRHNQNTESGSKFQDQAHRIYTDSLRKKHPNGGPYPLNGMNGLALTNGHGPPHGHGPPGHRMNIDINPLANMEHGGHHRSQPPPLGQREMYSGKPYHHGNGIIPNGTLPGYGHGHTSDNNFNNIRHTVSTDDVIGTGMIPNGVNCMGPGVGTGGGYSSRPYPPSSHSRTSLSSFTHNPPPHHPHHRRRGGSLSQSDEQDSPDETEPLARESPRYARDSPSYSSSGRGHNMRHNSRDNVRDGLYERRPCYGYEGTYDSGSGYRVGGEEGVPGYHPWVPGVGSGTGPSPCPSSSSHTGKHKRRRKRPHSERDREHATKDQATNTDLSSNEGTIEFGMLNKSPTSSLSNGSDNSMGSNTTGSNSMDVKTRTANGTPGVSMLHAPPPVVVLPVRSL
ncbi:interference hedgehog-like isoform X2 [Littorina saxatilis]|uniref:interference hedgehog-like isoform X2 n=1 Tax=Littorina saxatilis TaxID=31220 RepID=UPI0038B50E77